MPIEKLVNVDKTEVWFGRQLMELSEHQLIHEIYAEHRKVSSEIFSYTICMFVFYKNCIKSGKCI